MEKHSNLVLCILIVFILLLPIHAHAEAPEVLMDMTEFERPNSTPQTQWHGGAHLGLSPYTGVIGGELQYGRYAVTLGMPACAGFKYYLSDEGIHWFVGAHSSWYKAEDAEEEKDNINYDDVEIFLIGTGFGYKWRFKDHWDLSVSLSIAYYEEKLSNADTTDDERIDDYFVVFPGISIGYSF
jgi:hypothetical protein